MEEITLKKRLQVVELYFSGLSFDQISAKSGVSKGSVANIINELKAGNFPEVADITDQIETLRELSVTINKLKITVGKSAVGIALLNRIYELNLDPADMERWPLLLHNIKSQDDAHEIIEAAYAVRGIQEETGLSLGALEEKVKNLGEKAKELETIIDKIEEVKNELSALAINKKDLTEKVSSLDDKFDWLKPRVQELEKREKLLLDRYESRLIEANKADETLNILKLEMKKLQKTGLTVQGLTDFNIKLELVAKRHNLKPSVVRQRLLLELRNLEKGLGLETLVQTQKQILKETNQAITKQNANKLSLEAVVNDLQQQKQNLEAVIKETTTSVRLQIENIVPAAKNTMKQITGDLKSGCSEVLAEVRQLKEDSIQVGQEIGQYEGILKEGEWVKKLTELIHGGDSINAKDVKTIALLVNQNISVWLEQHNMNSPDTGLLAINTKKFLEEFVKWPV